MTVDGVVAAGSGDGVWFAGPAPLQDPDLVPVTVANVLGIRGEPGRPALDTLIGASEAVQLFIERAAQHWIPLVWDQQNASMAGRICRRLDGIPLAIELAAARLRVMSMTDLHARLYQRFSLLTGGAAWP